MRTHIAVGEPEAHGSSQPNPEVQGSQQVKDPGRQGEALSWGLRHHEAHLKPAHFWARCGAVCQSQPPSAEGQERAGTGELSSKGLSLEPRPNKEPSAALHLLPGSRPVSENSLPCLHPAPRCLQGGASSVSPQARSVSPSSPHRSLLTLSLWTPLCPRMRMRTSGSTCGSSQGWAPRTRPHLCQSNSHSMLSAFGNLPRWGPPLCRGWAHSGLDLHPMGSEPHSSGYGNPYCGSTAPCAPTCCPLGHLSPSLAPPALYQAPDLDLGLGPQHPSPPGLCLADASRLPPP